MSVHQFFREAVSMNTTIIFYNVKLSQNFVMMEVKVLAFKC